ncbi:MAG: PQQ-binding-like beta-propeller repeat protein [Bacteroidota bacterium]
MEVWDRGQIRSTAGIHNNKIIFVSGDGLLYCLDKASGKTIWTFKTGGEKLYPLYSFADYYQSSPQIKDGHVYFGSGDGNIYAVNEADGSLLWKYTTGDMVHATPALDGDKLFVGSFDGYVYALNNLTGVLLWKFKAVGHRYFPKGEMQGTPLVFNGSVFIGSRDYNLYALNEKSGYGMWNRQFPRGWAMAPPVIKDSVMYVGTSDDFEMHAIDPQTGKSKWKTNVKFNIFGGSAFKGQNMYFGTLMGKLFALDVKTGDVKWIFLTDAYKSNRFVYFKDDDTFRDDFVATVSKPNGMWLSLLKMGAIFSTPAIAQNSIVFTTMDGQVYCISLPA